MRTVGLPAGSSTLQPSLPSKATGAAKDFEALLIGQMLQSIREQGSGWLGGGEDDSSAAAFGIGEQHLAAAIAAGGGLGLGRVIERSLAKSTSVSGDASSSAPQPVHALPEPGSTPPRSLVRQG